MEAAEWVARGQGLRELTGSLRQRYLIAPFQRELGCQQLGIVRWRFGFGCIALVSPTDNHLLTPPVLLQKLLVEGGTQDTPLLGLPECKQPVVDPDLPLGLGCEQWLSNPSGCINLI